VTHSVNGQPIQSECSYCTKWRVSACPVHGNPGKPVSPGGFFGVAPAQPTSSEGVVYANLVDAVKMLNKMIERTSYNCTREEAELIWRLRFVTRIKPQ
jgi:hypothetical protein